jgi:hypothetical protein
LVPRYLRERDVDGDHYNGQDDGVGVISPANGQFLLLLTPTGDTTVCPKEAYSCAGMGVLAPSTPMLRARPATSTGSPNQKYVVSSGKHPRTEMKGLPREMAR